MLPDVKHTLLSCLLIIQHTNNNNYGSFFPSQMEIRFSLVYVTLSEQTDFARVILPPNLHSLYFLWFSCTVWLLL